MPVDGFTKQRDTEVTTDMQCAFLGSFYAAAEGVAVFRAVDFPVAPAVILFQCKAAE